MNRVVLAAFGLIAVAVTGEAHATPPGGDGSAERASQHRGEVSLVGGYGEGSSVFRAGVGGRLGLSLKVPSRFYLGTFYMHHFGEEGESSDRFGLELGPTFLVGRILLRPLVGVGAIAPQRRYCDSYGCDTESVSMDWTVAPYLTGGALAAWRFGDVFVGLDVLLVAVIRGAQRSPDEEEGIGGVALGAVFGVQL